MCTENSHITQERNLFCKFTTLSFITLTGFLFSMKLTGNSYSNYARMDVCTWRLFHVCACAHIHTHARTHTHIHTPTQTHTHAHARSHTHARRHTQAHARRHARMHTYTHRHIDRQTDTTDTQALPYAFAAHTH